MSPRRWLPAFLWTAIVLTLTSIPNPNIPTFAGGDKVAHALMYAVLGALVGYALMGVRRPLRAVARAIVGIAILAALDELHQRLIPGRSAEVGDWVADVAGSTTAVLISVTALRRRELQT